eukprot:2248459-Prorocentrum_lima.AAC.1
MQNNPEWDQPPRAQLTHPFSCITKTLGNMSSTHAPGTRRPRSLDTGLHTHCCVVCKNFVYDLVHHH